MAREIGELRLRALAFERTHDPELRDIDPAYRPSARNLLHYLSLRQHDLRPLQDELSSLGLSSLGRLEAHTMATLTAVLATLHGLNGRGGPFVAAEETPVDFWSGPQRLKDHTRGLLGDEPANRRVRVMVTVPSEAAENAVLVRELVRAGMDVKLRQKLTDAFLALDRDKAQDKAILDLQRARGFIPAEPARPAQPSP